METSKIAKMATMAKMAKDGNIKDGNIVSGLLVPLEKYVFIKKLNSQVFSIYILNFGKNVKEQFDASM